MKVSSPSCSAVTGLNAESAASIVELEAAGDTPRRVQMSWAGSTSLPADGGHTGGLAVLGRVRHSTRIGILVETCTTGDPGHNAAANGLIPAGWIVAFDRWRWEGIAADS